MASNISKLIEEVYKAQSGTGELKSKALTKQMQAREDSAMKQIETSISAATAAAKQEQTKEIMSVVMKVVGAVVMAAGVIAAVASGQPELAVLSIAVGVFFISGGADALIGAMGDAIGSAITTDLEATGMKPEEAKKVGKMIGHMVAAIIVAILVTALTCGIGGLATAGEAGAEVGGQVADDTEQGIEMVVMNSEDIASDASSTTEELVGAAEDAGSADQELEESNNLVKATFKKLLKALKNRTWKSGGVKSMVLKGTSSFLQTFTQAGGVSDAVSAGTQQWIDSAPNAAEKQIRESAASGIQVAASILATAAALGAGGAGAAADSAKDVRSISGLISGKTAGILNASVSGMGVASGMVAVGGDSANLALATKSAAMQKSLGQSKAMSTVYKMLTSQMQRSNNQDYKQTMDLVKKDNKMLAAIQAALVTESQAANSALTQG
jgi:hypothetical protein